jgi:hypothetical protein
MFHELAHCINQKDEIYQELIKSIKDNKDCLN